MAETLCGTVERVTHHNTDTGFAVLRVVPRGRRGIATVICRLLAVNAGEQIEARGEWVFDPQHGEQFRAEAIRCRPPSTVEGIEKYLASGLVKGIGPTYARKIVEVFGERTLQVIDESPSFLKEIKGLGAARISKIRESWREQKAVRDIMVFLQSHGLGTQRAVRIYKTYGDQAVEIVTANPYRLATDIWGVGFQTADDLGRKIGIQPDSPQRARAALLFALKTLSTDGHVGHPEEGVIAATEAIPDLPPAVIRAAVEDLRKEGEIVREPGDPPWLYLKPLFLAELGIARAVRRIQRGPHPLDGMDFTTALDRMDDKMGIQLATSQREALRQATAVKMLVVTGGPGTGKTTLVRGILELFASRRMRCALCAPTGRAARRLGDTTGKEAKTIHRLLEFDPALGGFKRTAVNQLEIDLLVVDETSMVDVALMNQLLAAVPSAACVVLVGDTDQLPSVGPGMVLADLINSSVVPVVRLAEIFRQAGRSHIVRAAHQIKAGEIPESAPGATGDFFFVEADTPEMIRSRLLTLVRERIPRRFGLDPIRDVQILAPMNRSELGTQALNEMLQAALVPLVPGQQIERFGCSFRVGDKVMQRQNNYTREVFNGDTGQIVRLDEKEREVVVLYDGREVVYDHGELDEIVLAHAVTVHKSQGSEYPAVVIPLHTQHFKMLQRNLLYTGVTRGKQVVVLVGSRKALEIAINNQDTQRRYSQLCQRLRKEASLDE